MLSAAEIPLATMPEQETHRANIAPRRLLLLERHIVPGVVLPQGVGRERPRLCRPRDRR